MTPTYLLDGMALVAEQYGVLLDLDRPMNELMFLISSAANLREKRAKEREVAAKRAAQR